MDIVRIGVIGLVGMLLALKLKQDRPEISILMSMAVCLVLIFTALKYLDVLVVSVKDFSEMLGEYSLFVGLLLKVVGVTYISEFCASLCKDAGYNAIATQIEMFGKFSILLIGMPVIKSLLEIIGKLQR